VKLMQSIYLQRIMKKNVAKGFEKTKPIQTQFLQIPEMNLKSLAGKSGHTLLWIYLNLFLTPPKQTVKVPPSDFEPRPSFHSEGRGETALLSLRKGLTWRL